MKKKVVTKHAGFTLIELMVVLAIVGILIMVGVPQLQTFMQGNRLVASTNELHSALHIARSEAIKLNSSVSMCTSDDSETCSDDNNWANGWIVFADANGDMAGADAACTAADIVGRANCLLRVHEGFNAAQLTISGLNNNTDQNFNRLAFSSRGLPEDNNGAGLFANFSLCRLDVGVGIIDSRSVILGLPGRARVSDNAVITCL